MKSQAFNLISHEVKANCIHYIHSLEANGKLKVTVSDIGTKSDRQRGLQWKWYADVAQSGIGGKHEDTKEGVHRVSKFRWAIPIFSRDSDLFAAIHKYFLTKNPDENMWQDYLDNHVHTEKFNTGQMAEFLDSFEKHYSSIGVDLTNPALYGLKFK